MKRLLLLLPVTATLFGLMPLAVPLASNAGPAAKAPPKTITNSIGMKFAYIPPGKFKMGSSEEEQKALMKEMDDIKEKPSWLAGEKEHEVEITKGFYLGVYEVTQKQYKEIMGKNPSLFCKDGRAKDKVKGMDTDDFPVEMVSWDDAQEFIKKLNALAKEKKEKRLYRLPTEAEWEWACRGGSAVKTTFHFGNSISWKQANFHGNHPYGGAARGMWLMRTCKVGSYKPNGYGLYDMHGNVEEWCEDVYDETFYSRSPKRDPLNTKVGPRYGNVRVIRGGSWRTSGWVCRSAHRSRSPFFGPGFRVALVPARD
jgi:formylglycine-generating enzyme required for sulfatase activity